MRLVAYSLCLVVLLTAPAWGKTVPLPSNGSLAQRGEPFDPSRNVLDIVEKETRRQDDLRTSFEKYVDSELRHVRDMAELRAENDKLLRGIDMERQQKVREVDVLGAKTETERAQVAIEATRKIVDSTAATIASQLDMKFTESNKRIAALEQISTLGQGSRSVSDPQMAEMVTELKNLRTLQTQGSGKDEGMDKLFGWIMSILTLLFGAGVGVYFGKKKDTPTPHRDEKLVREVP